MSEFIVKSLKCHTCGGDLDYVESNRYKCKRCGGDRYVQNYTNDEIALLQQADIERRYHMQFEKAMDGYEAVLKINPDNVNALWGMFLSEYGIEYVQDVDKTYKPTFNRLSPERVFANRYVIAALDLTSGDERNKYKKDAEDIEIIRKKTIEEAAKNPPYDIFICYKKTTLEDKNILTPEAAWAQDYYNEFTADRLKVFFADKSIPPGSAKEPPIYNALSTAKFMIILCSDIKHLNYAWVVNEWSRFLRRKKDDPYINFCVVYENIEPYDLPRGLREAQALNRKKASSFDTLRSAINKTFDKIENLKHTLKLNTIEIKGGQVAQRASKVLTEQIKRVELGTYKIGEVTVSDKMRIKEVNECIRAGSFKYALEIIDNELHKQNENNYEVLFAKLLAQTNSRNEDDFWKISNLKNRPLIDNLLRCAPKVFAENFINNWMQLCIDENTIEGYSAYLETLAKYDVKNRNILIKAAQKYAEKTCDEHLIQIVERCFDVSDVDRFINFYSAIAENYYNKNNFMFAEIFFKKILAIDSGHSIALFSLFKIHYFSRYIFKQQVYTEFELICKYSTQVQRENYLDEVIKVLIDYAHVDNSKFDSAAQFYLSLYTPSGGRQKQAANKIYSAMQEKAYFSLAEKFCAMAITLDEKNENLYFDLLQIKLYCKSSNELEFVDSPKIRNTDEYRMAQQCATEHNNEKFLTMLGEISRKQFDNIESGNTREKLKKKANQSKKKSKKASFFSISAVRFGYFYIVAAIIFAIISAQFLYDIKLLGTSIVSVGLVVSIIVLSFFAYLSHKTYLEYEEPKLKIQNTIIIALTIICATLFFIGLFNMFISEVRITIGVILSTNALALFGIFIRKVNECYDTKSTVFGFIIIILSIIASIFLIIFLK